MKRAKCAEANTETSRVLNTDADKKKLDRIGFEESNMTGEVEIIVKFRFREQDDGLKKMEKYLKDGEKMKLWVINTKSQRLETVESSTHKSKAWHHDADSLTRPSKTEKRFESECN